MRIPLGRSGEYDAIVDAEDYAYLTRHRWHAAICGKGSRRKIYARRNTTIAGKRVTIYMHTEVLLRSKGLPPSDKHTGDHDDRDGLNNTRENLDWADKRQQANNQRGRTPVFTPSAATEVPF